MAGLPVATTQCDPAVAAPRLRRRSPPGLGRLWQRRAAGGLGAAWARPQLVCGWLSTSACSLHVAVRNHAWAAAASGSPWPDDALAGRLKPLAAVLQRRLADLLVPAAEGQP